MHAKPVCLLFASFVSFFFILPAAPVGAQAVWNGNISTDWFTAGNWSTNVVPTASTDVDISSAVTAVINAPGAVSNNSSIGLIAGSSGMVDVSGGSWTNSGNLIVGDSGSGALSLSAGTVSNTGSSLVAAAYLGFNPDSGGTVTVTGGTWDNNNRLWVGYSGAGELNISGTGAVTNFACVLGNFAGSSGTANVSGGTWHTTGIFVVGQLGTGELNISGGQVTHQFSGVTVGGGASGTANVSGGTWTPISLSIGAGSTGTLNISGTATVNSGLVTLGVGISGSGTATVSGGNWNAGSGVFHIGQAGAGQLTISGGSVLSSAVYLGETTDTASGTATVSGGTWTVNNEFIVGSFGTGELNISGTGTVNVAGGVGNTTLGVQAQGSGTVNVSGGTWSNNGLLVGALGTGELNISGAGAVSSLGGTLGQNAGSSGTANVSGGTWTISGGLSVGNSGAGVLNVSAGAVSNTFSTLGANAGSTGAASVSGGTWTTSGNSLFVGDSGAGELTIAGTGMVSAGAGGGTVSVARLSGSNGMLNFGDGAGAPGALLAAQVNGGLGTAKVNFNHTSTAYSFAPQLTGSLAVEVMQGGTIFTAANTYTGGATISGGTLTLANPSGAGTGAIEIDGGTLDISDQTIGNTVVFGALGGTIKSSGASGGMINSELSLTNTNQIVSPGNSPGILGFGTSQSWDSYTYLWEVNDWSGTTAGTEFDQIQITGGLTLTGASEGSYILDITSLMASNLAGDVSNFSDADQSWTFLTTTNGITGFDPGVWTLDTASFESSPDWTGEFSIIQVGNDLLLNYTAVPEPTTGDFDLDGDVDGRDFLVWQREESPSPLSASDLADWQANYGTGATAGLSSSVVPEPASWVILLCGAILATRCRTPKNAISTPIA